MLHCNCHEIVMTTPMTIVYDTAMDDGLCIGNLPDWRYAGKRADSVIPNARLREGSQEIDIFLHASPDKPDEFIKREYVVESGYLIPRYPVHELEYKRREEELLKDRVQRFFYSAEPGIDINRTGPQIALEIELFDSKLREINLRRHYEGLPAFNFSTPYRQMAKDELQLMAQGAQFVGHAVNRLGRLGCIIIQGNRHGIKFEHDDAYVTAHMDEIKREFTTLWTKIAFTDKDIVRCVQTRDGKPDYDGIFADLIREIAKPLQPILWGEHLTTTSNPESELNSRRNIITKIGYTLEAIDEVAAAMRSIYQHPEFSQLIKRAGKKESAADFTVKDYRGLLSEYIEVSRARAVIKTEDADNFNPVAARLRYLQTELTLHHESLFKNTQYSIIGKGIHDERLEKAISTLKRGVALMGEMAELRMPRSHRALDVYDRDDKDFKDRDASSVGRYKEEVKELRESLKGRGFTR